MRSLSPIILLSGLTFCLHAQSPHGTDLKTNCAECHTPAGWEIEMDTFLFNHDRTNFSLEGQHGRGDCRDCHQSLVFAEASTECIACHTDIHRTTVGSDCARCHTPKNWLVDIITEIHQDNGFPLLGIHATTSCNDCHVSESNLEFHRIGNDCVNCHLDNFDATTNPNHRDAGFSTDCTDCHAIDGFDWSSENIIHDFFPLTKGHDIADCAKCHTAGDFSNLPTDCVECHKMDFDNAQSPNHQSSNFPTDCAECHTTDIGWSPAVFDHDELFFPIYSGKHKGEWNDCIECHTNPGNFSEFSCIDCHKHNDPNKLADKHKKVSDYEFSSQACYACHPDGDE